jgi:hypothetical protein
MHQLKIMRKVIVIPLILIAIHCCAQVAENNLSRSSVSVTGGVNAVYPTEEINQQVSNRLNPWLAFTYNFIIVKTFHTLVGLKAGFDYFHDQYYYSDAIKLNAGLFLTQLISNIKWYNEVEFLNYILNNGISSNSFVNLQYKTGITFQANHNLTFTPLLAFPILGFTSGGEESGALFGQLKPFNNIQIGVMLTYNFSKKQQ